MSSEARSENKLGVMPIGRLLASMSLPMMVSMFVQALYNIVDSIFVAMLSEEALTAVSLAFPAQMLMMAVTIGTGVGMNAYLSKSLGEKNFETVNKIAGNAFILYSLSFLVFMTLGIFAVKPFFAAQTNDAAIYDAGVAYLRICLCGSFGIMMEVYCSRMLQSTGRASLSMTVQLTGAMTNMILDPILIFGYFGAPALGITGAALATVAGQIAAASLAVFLNMRSNHDITFGVRYIRPEMSIIKRIYSVGVPSIVMASLGSFMVFGLNGILMSYSATAAAVLGVYFKVQSFAFMPVFGLNNGMVPIIAYNFGARRPDRINRTIVLGIISAISVLSTATLIFLVFPAEIFALFSASSNMLEIGIPALRMISIHFPVAGFCICTISVCQALGHGSASLIVAFVRQIVVLLPAAYVLSHLFGLSAVWWSFAIGEGASFALCLLMMGRMQKMEIAPLKGGITS